VECNGSAEAKAPVLSASLGNGWLTQDKTRDRLCLHGRPQPPSTVGAGLFLPHRWDALRCHFGLSPRQLQVAQLVCDVLETKQIASELALSVDTVRMHLKELFRKAGVDSRVGLVVKLVRSERLLGERGRSAECRRGAEFQSPVPRAAPRVCKRERSGFQPAGVEESMTRDLVST
jgi:DNA-binding CsgD family transcriptional regulator